MPHKERDELDRKPSEWCNSYKEVRAYLLDQIAQDKTASAPSTFLGHVTSLITPQCDVLDPHGKALLAAAVCNATWTQSRLAEAGYKCSPMCVRCGQSIDTVWHRAWECPHSAELRAFLVSHSLVADALSAGPHSMLFSRGIVPHPVDELPSRASDGGVAFWSRAGEDPNAHW